MNLHIVTTLFVLTIQQLSIESYRILGVYPFQSRSHQMLFDGITRGLLRKGHQVDVVTVYPMKPTANYSVVVNLANKREKTENNWDFEFAARLGDNTLPIIALSYGNGLCEYLGLPEMQRLIKNPPTDPPYDVVIVESFGANCFIGLGYVLKVPVVMASSTIDLPWLDEGLGQPFYSAFFPAFFTVYTHPMRFFERLHNTVVAHLNIFRYRRFTDEIQNELMKKYLSPDIPPMQELEKDVLAVVNSWHTLHGVRPLTPAIVEIAGLHVHENYIPLSKDIEKWMNESSSGVVYFTLGSMVNIETLPEDTMRAFYSTFRRIAPVNVLMKIADKNQLPEGLPKNVITSPWIPQIAVLSHKNTKLFITHGGLMGTQEALTFGVPLIGIPLFADQYSNMAVYKANKMALILDKRNLTEENIFGAVNEILTNPLYSKSAKHESARFLDRPQSAVDTAVYWIEYAVRHGSGALRSPAVDLTWWQVALLDVYLFLLVATIFLLYIVVFAIKACLKFLLSSKKSITKKKHD